MKSRSLTGRIREEARSLGFFKVGVTPARPLPGRRNFDRWLAGGMHGEMAYMAEQAPRRRDPSLVLPLARSLVVLAMNYHSGHELTGDPLKGKISRYAWGDDYHHLIRKRLRALCGFIRQHAPGSQCLYYVDTGPVMEKVWGARSALGWMGKHTNLITRDQGSWFFLGVILLDVELEYDRPEEDYCGTCDKCIAACPTGAIVAPYVVDARLCISYLTIELRGPIPRELRPLVGNRIYGCDDCQEVCPWNRFAAVTGEGEFHPRRENLMPDLAPLVDLTPEEFRDRYRGSAVRRAKRDGFVRNVVVALGNSGRPEALAALIRASNDTSPMVRAHAAWALGRIGGAAAGKALYRRRAEETEAQVVAEIDLSLAGARV